MSFDWTHQFCLACDKQTDSATYCSESCRLADYEKTSSTPSSGPSSPALSGPSYPWSTSKSAPTQSRFYLSPAYDFSNPHPYGSSLPAQRARPGLIQTTGALSPSSSQSSLCSMKSNASAGSDAGQLSEKAKRELQAYASSFEHVRLQRRRSH